jgi:hypothetical protein
LTALVDWFPRSSRRAFGGHGSLALRAREFMTTNRSVEAAELHKFVWALRGKLSAIEREGSPKAAKAQRPQFIRGEAALLNGVAQEKRKLFETVKGRAPAGITGVADLAVLVADEKETRALLEWAESAEHRESAA